MSLRSGRRGNDRELPLLDNRRAEPQSRRECRLSNLPGTDLHLANSTLSLGFPGTMMMEISQGDWSLVIGEAHG